MTFFKYPWPIVKKAHALGLINTHIPQKYGLFVEEKKFNIGIFI